MRIWQRALAVPTIVLAVLLGTVTQAQAAPTRATLAAAVSAVEYETVGGSNYAYYKGKYPSQIDWSKDGCSVPVGVWISPALGLVLHHYSGVFRASCDRHDFGYRNYGHGSTTGVHLRLDLSRARKDSVDARFKSNMKVQCDRAYPGLFKAPARAACKGAADVYYEAVHKFGDKAYFG